MASSKSLKGKKVHGKEKKETASESAIAFGGKEKRA